ncbi:hypothetical protein D3C72_2030540 [compost metagenome]
MIYKTDISNLKSDMEDRIGQKIIVKGSVGRSKTFEKEATIIKADASKCYFQYENDWDKATYTYVDILTRTIEIDVMDNENKSCPLLPPQIETPRRRRQQHEEL